VEFGVVLFRIPANYIWHSRWQNLLKFGFLNPLFHFFPVLAFLQKDGEIVLMKRDEYLASAFCWLNGDFLAFCHFCRFFTSVLTSALPDSPLKVDNGLIF
jgi:hypothetical protein